MNTSQHSSKQLLKGTRIKANPQGQFALSALIYKHKSCELCRKSHNQASMVLCDRCEDAYHIRCIGLDRVPQNTWLCRSCQEDVISLKKQQLTKKGCLPQIPREQCRLCLRTQKQIFQLKKDTVRYQVLFRDKQVCISCGYSFHAGCFSRRAQSLNCLACQKSIRDLVPKGHIYFQDYVKSCRAHIANLNFLELVEGFKGLKQSEKCMQLLNLKAPERVTDWRTIVSYQASLCYALVSRRMVYCQNLVLHMDKDKIDAVYRAHTNSVQKIYRLHRTDQQVYQAFKQNMHKGNLPPLQVRQDRKKGFYLVSTSFIPARTLLSQYTGQLLTSRESLNMLRNDNIFTLIRNPRSCQSLDIGPSRFANISIFISGINNAQEGEDSPENVRSYKFSYKGVARVVFVAMRDIAANQTLYLNYNGDKAIAEYPTQSFTY